MPPTQQQILDRVIVCGITEAFHRIHDGEKIGAVLSAIPTDMITEAPDGRKLMAAIADKKPVHYTSYMFNIYSKKPELFRALESVKLPYYEAEIAETLDTGVRMFKGLKGSEKMIIHCLNAKSRSPTLAVTLFMKLLGGTRHRVRAFDILNKICPHGVPNRFTEEFRKHLGKNFDAVLSDVNAYCLDKPPVPRS